MIAIKMNRRGEVLDRRTPAPLSTECFGALFKIILISALINKVHALL